MDVISVTDQVLSSLNVTVEEISTIVMENVAEMLNMTSVVSVVVTVSQMKLATVMVT